MCIFFSTYDSKSLNMFSFYPKYVPCTTLAIKSCICHLFISNVTNKTQKKNKFEIRFRLRSYNDSCFWLLQLTTFL